ncbi:MAG TPA: glycosyltransferase, partial [Actinomycetota bacterium]|nr:glycosyltransferase [Actinomycetota bacterium]
MSDPKRIVLWHGYLLTGSGSNIYTAALAREWRNAGHDVLLLCQEKRAGDFDFVDAHGDAQRDNRGWRVAPTTAIDSPGRCVVVRPDIAGLLPVYVWDAYEGFEVKRFVELSDEELDRYTEANLDALVTAIELHDPDAIVVGHEVMGPAIARKACAATKTRYLAKLHGSALEYAVKLQDRYRRHAFEGLSGAAVVTAGSRYMIEEASSVIPGWKERAVVVNPGCDVQLFRPRPRADSAPPTVGYVGKLIAAKGPQDLIAALGLTRSPGLRAVVVGFGTLEQRLRELAESLATGDVGRALTIASVGESGAPLGSVLRFLRSKLIDDRYLERVAAVPIDFLGRLDHGPLATVLPTFDVLVVPSVVPEAFGMVAAEAAACGVLPIVPRHSGIGEVGATLEAEMGEPGLLTFDPRTPIEGIALAIDRVLSLPVGRRAELGSVAVEVARRRWSWRVVAERLLA